MTPVKSADDISIGDAVEVRDHDRISGSRNRRRGSVVRVGKASAVIAFDSGEVTVRYVKRVTVDRGWRGTAKGDFHPISKLSEHELWAEKEPKSDHIWGANGPSLIVSRRSARDNLEAVILHLRAYNVWLTMEPKEDS